VEYYNRLAKAGLPFVQLDGARGIAHEGGSGGATTKLWMHDAAQRQLRPILYQLHRDFFKVKSNLIHKSDKLEMENQAERRIDYFSASLDGFPVLRIEVFASTVSLAVQRTLKHIGKKLSIPRSCLGISSLIVHAGNCNIEMNVVVRF
jgi:hypothetical protein